MEVTLIGANIVAQKRDFSGTGIPYFPLVTAYTAATLRKHKINFNLIDAFGENPFKITEKEDKIIQGLTPEEISEKISLKTDLIIIPSERVVAHKAVLSIINHIRNITRFSTVPILILENTQAVTAYALRFVSDELFSHGADYIITGEPEEKILSFIDTLSKKGSERASEMAKIPGIIFKNEEGEEIFNNSRSYISDIDSLGFPPWDLFNLENYWKLEYAHGPLTSNKYLPLLTSRGCPYPCTFCVVPETNEKKWRSRSAKNVVDEIEICIKSFRVHEYHLEDLNPTIDKRRIKEIAKEIIRRKLKISWKIASGTKAETLDKETIIWMALSGCTYVSISPESGSKEIMKKIGKPFPYDKVLDLVSIMHKSKISTQACFVLGYPGETDDDLLKTKDYIKKLVKAGISEIALFILTTVPGSVVYQNHKEFRPPDPSNMTFTPKWRKDIAKYEKIRNNLYFYFLFCRLRYFPLELILQPLRIMRKSFRTKMEMTIYRLTKVWWLSVTQRNKTI